MIRTLGHTWEGRAVLATDEKIIESALLQERGGIAPHYALYNHQRKGVYHAPGLAGLVAL